MKLKQDNDDLISSLEANHNLNMYENMEDQASSQVKKQKYFHKIID